VATCGQLDDAPPDGHESSFRGKFIISDAINVTEPELPEIISPPATHQPAVEQYTRVISASGDR
jgi:hypothetical protein